MTENSVPARINFETPGPPQFANYVVLQTQEHEFYVSFYHISPPLLLGDGRMDEDKLRGLLETGIDAKLVSHIVMPISRLPELKRLFLNTPTVSEKNDSDPPRTQAKKRK